MATPPMVSIAIPVYRPDRRLFSCMIQSVLDVARAYGNVEILLHNDGNEPATAKLLKKTCLLAPDMIKVSGAYPNAGIPASRQFLLERAAGTYFVHFDQDDIMLPFDLASIVDFLEKHRDYVLDYGSNILTEDEGTKLSFEIVPFSRFSVFWHFLVRPNACVLRTSALRASGGYANCPRNTPDDVWMFQNIFQLGEVRRGGRRTAHIVHGNNASSSSKYGLQDKLSNARAFLMRHPREEALIRSGVIPTDVSPYILPMLVGAVYLTNPNGEESRRILEKAIEITPKDWELRCVWMLVNASIRNETVVRDEMNAAPRLFGDDPEALYCYATMVLTISNQFNAKIIDHWRGIQAEAGERLLITERERDTILRLLARPLAI